MKPDLTGYVLRILEPAQEQEVEEYLEAHPEARQEVLMMRPLLRVLAVDEPEPSKDLVYRTLRALANLHCTEPEPDCKTSPSSLKSVEVKPQNDMARQLPSLEPWKQNEYEASASHWRRADAVALIAVVMLILLAIPPVLQYVRDRAMQVECKNNLRQIYSSMQRYMQDHDGAIPSLSDNRHAGTYASMLRDAGLWGERMRLGCPPGSPTVPQSLAEVDKHRDDELSYWQKFAGSYAYHLGYTQNEKDSGSVIRSLRHGDGDHLPILADRPARFGEVTDWTVANSPNHGGRGQNVLYLGGHADFRKVRTCGEDRDIFRNYQNLQEAGANIKDVVLGLPESRPKPKTPVPVD
jgi:type II secretory pathway pseudopilin PulG